MHNVTEAEASRRAEELLEQFKPELIRAIQENGSKGARFDGIESSCAAVGDLLARELMCEALEAHGLGIQESEEQQLVEEYLGKAAPGQTVEGLRIKRVKDKARTIKTIRGPVPYARDYLYFPALKGGLFPPRREAGVARGEADAPCSEEVGGSGGVGQLPDGGRRVGKHG